MFQFANPRPIAIGFSVKPMINTRKKVPISSIIYFFMNNFLNLKPDSNIKII